jgi:quinol monooxygenase YgiN
MDNTAIYVSTFRAKKGSENLLLRKLKRLASRTRQQSACLFCDLYRQSSDQSVFFIHSVFENRAAWEAHIAGLGLMSQCLLKPVEIIEMEEPA